MTLSSQLIQEGSPSPSVFGVHIDVDDVTPPEGLREVSIVSPTENGEISDLILDVAISWTLAQCDVTLEIPFESEISDIKHMLSTVAAVGISLSLLPPEELSEDSFERYCSRVVGFAEAYVTQANMAKMLVPVTSYLGYMFIEALSPDTASDFKPSDDYIIERFHSKVSIERSDALKARIRKVFHEAYGGKEGFRSFALNLTGAVYSKVEEGCISEAERQHHLQSSPSGSDSQN